MSTFIARVLAAFVSTLIVINCGGGGDWRTGVNSTGVLSSTSYHSMYATSWLRLQNNTFRIFPSLSSLCLCLSVHPSALCLFSLSLSLCASLFSVLLLSVSLCASLFSVCLFSLSPSLCASLFSLRLFSLSLSCSFCFSSRRPEYSVIECYSRFWLLCVLNGLVTSGSEGGYNLILLWLWSWQSCWMKFLFKVNGNLWKKWIYGKKNSCEEKYISL